MHVIVRSVLCLSIGTVCSFAHPQFLNERHVYLRGEMAVLRIRVPGAEGRVVADTSGWFPETLTARGGEVAYKLNTALLRAGEYEVRARMLPTGSTPEDIAIFPLTIAAERNPQRFPLWNWQNAYSSDLSWWTARGFNGLRLRLGLYDAPGIGPELLLSALPVFVIQGAMTYGAHCCQPFLEANHLLDATNAVGGLLVFCVSLVILELKRLDLGDYLPSLIAAPLVAWCWR